MRDHLGIHRQHFGVAAGMIVVLVSIKNVLDGFVGDRSQLLQNFIVIAVEHIVHQDHAFVRHLDRDVSSANALCHADDEQIVLQLLNADRRRGGLGLGVGEPGARESGSRGAGSYQGRPEHSGTLPYFPDTLELCACCLSLSC